MKLKISLAVLLAAGMIAAPAAGEAKQSSSVAGHHSALAAAVSVDLFAGGKQQGASASHLGKPFQRPNVARGIGNGARIATANLSPAATAPQLTQVSTFPMMNFDTQVAALGIGQ